MAERHESALKATRQNAKHRLVNRRNLGKVKAAVRAQREVLAKGNAEQAAAATPETQSALDRAVAKRVIHRNAAARRKSRLQKKLNKLAAGAGK
jgi:small subunit ribosomal protein S20